MNVSLIGLIGVIIILLSSICAETDNFNNLIVDISKDCENNYSTSIHLPYGTGSADARVILLRSISSLVRKCSIAIMGSHSQNSCKDKCMTVLVVEFFNYHTWNTSCTAISGGIFLTSKGKQFADVCADIHVQHTMKNEREHQMHAYLVRRKKFSVNISFTNFSGTIKMTATSANYLGNYNNCTENEIFCILEGQVFCIDKLLECDGNLNCGTPNLYDEYCSTLYAQENILFTIIYGTCLLVIIMYFFVQLLRVCVPTVADHFFVFNEDEEYKFVLTSQSLPPVEPYRIIEEEEIQHSAGTTTDTHTY